MTLSPRAWKDNPAYESPGYKSSSIRGPRKAPIPIARSLSEMTGPRFTSADLAEHDADLTRNSRINGEPLGERIVVTGRVLDEDGDPVPNMLIEVWQCNSAGRYIHRGDVHDAPLDPNFLGAGEHLIVEPCKQIFGHTLQR